MAALLSAGERLDARPSHPAPSDLLVMMERDWTPNARRIHDQLVRLMPRESRGRDEESLLVSILTGFPDRVARRRAANEYLLAGGGSAILADSSGVAGEEFIVAIDVEARRERGLPLIRIASAIRPDCLVDLNADRVEAREGVEWNRQAERVDAVSALRYDGLVLEESRGGVPDADAAAEMLAKRAADAGIGRFVDRGELDAFLARAAFAAARSSIAAPSLEDVLAVLQGACRGKRSFAELERVDVIAAVRASRREWGRLDEVAPERIRLPGGRAVRVHYEAGKLPWIESRLQDFFGMKESPRIGGVPVVVHLLAPNHRPVQTTADLAGFWERLYPQVRRELSRRYPKHSWPERPV